MARRKKPYTSRDRRVRIDEAELKAMIRQAAHAGLVAAIEHSHNFWQVGDGYKKYIEAQIKSEAEALKLAVRVAIRDVLAERPWKRRKKR